MATTELTSFPGWVYSTPYRGPYKNKIIIADLPNVQKGSFTDISAHVTNVSVNYTMDLASELSFDIIDPSLLMSENNYFLVGRDIIYETQTLGQVDPYSPTVKFVKQLFEIANVGASQGPGGSVSYSIKCYTKAIQQMKRDKTPGTVKGSGSNFIINAAKKYGLKAYTQQTSKSQSIKSSGEKQRESLWDVMKRLADDANFVLFEVDGFLIFGSEEWLMHKWGVDRNVASIKVRLGSKRDMLDKKKDGISKKVQRWVPLQFPNEGPQYVGTPGVFKLTQYPSINKSDNDPREADGSCTVERINGTQLRPGMTTYVGTIPNMSGFYLIDSVSFNEMSPDSVPVSFRTPKRDEKKYKIKQIAVGERYAAVTLSENPPRVVTVAQEAKDAAGQPVVKRGPDPRLLPIPTATTNNYPTMPYANLTITYPLFKSEIIQNGKYGEDSTNDQNSVIYTGNLNLYNRPILIVDDEDIRTTYSVTLGPFLFGSEWRAVIVPTIFTQGGLAVQKTEAEVLARYNSQGGYAGTAKYLAVVRGDTKKKAILNARDYGTLISWQQQEILKARYPNARKGSDIGNVPGGADSNW